MEYGVADIARHAGTSVDTIRYYQSLGLLPPPRHEGRSAVYDETHVERLRRIRDLAARGFSLKAIREILDAGGRYKSDRPLLSAIAQSAKESRYSASELARELDIPRAILTSIERSGLVDDTPGSPGEEAKRFTGADLEVARGAVRLLRYGFPVRRLLALAVKHDAAVRRVVDEAIDLFDEHVRKAVPGEEDPAAVAEAFRELLPVTTALVAHHFQRRLVHRALKRLQKSGHKEVLDVAVKEAKTSRFRWRWK